MLDTNKQCMYCEKTDGLVKFDSTGNWFCSLVHFQEYHKARNINNANQSHDQINSQQILNITQEDNAFIKSLKDKPTEDQLQIIQTRITQLVQLQQTMRLSEMNLKKRVMNIRDLQESDKVERYRKAGCNSDLELKEKKLSKLGKMLVMYKKMNMSADKIVEVMTSISKFSREEILKELKAL